MVYSNCHLRWNCENSRVLLNGVLFDDADSGELANPSLGIYQLQQWDGTSWVLKKQLNIDSLQYCGNLSQQNCCMELTNGLGRYARPSTGFISGATGLFSFANGTWVIDTFPLSYPIGTFVPNVQPCIGYGQYLWNNYPNASDSIVLFEEYYGTNSRMRIYQRAVTVQGGPWFEYGNGPFQKRTYAAFNATVQMQTEYLTGSGWAIDHGFGAGGGQYNVSNHNGQTWRESCGIGSGYYQGNHTKQVVKANTQNHGYLPTSDVVLNEAGLIIYGVDK